MNRLIIIGNGFDLAHGIKSSSKDLVLHYLRNVWGKLSIGSFEDRLLKIQKSGDYFRKNDLGYSDENALSIFKKIHKDNSSGENDAYMSIKSNFFKAIFDKINSLSWADFETEYFHELYDILELSNKRKKNNGFLDRISLESHKNSSIKRLNEDFDFLQDILIGYLKEQESSFLEIGTVDDLYKEYFFESIHEGEKEKNVIGLKPEEIYFLNFNYTNSLNKYCEGLKVNHIHGTLNNNPIFGFGDDTSEKYYELENEYNNELLKKIKSFKYLDNSSYKELNNFIRSGEFQVHIYGHSCGVSDRTLFKQIFENEKCKSIKIFYHNEKDFEEKKYEISRHFKDKRSFLEKVLSFDNLRMMPQPCQK